MSITSKSIRVFDPKNVEHVLWLGVMCEQAEKWGSLDNRMNLVEEVNSNPFGIKLDVRDALDWPHIHFVLCAAYAKAVLRKEAFVPLRSS